MKKHLTVLLVVFSLLVFTSAGAFAAEKFDQNEKTISDATILIGKNPQDAIAYYKRGVAYNNKNAFDDALADYNKAIELNPKYAAAYLNRGVLYAAKRNQLDLALSDFSEAIKSDPQYELAYLNRGIAYRKTGQFALAIADMNKAIKLNSSNAKAYYNKGLTYEAMGSYEEAIATYKTLRQIIPPQDIPARDLDWNKLAKNQLRILGVQE